MMRCRFHGGVVRLLWVLVALVSACAPSDGVAPLPDAQTTQADPSSKGVRPVPMPDLSGRAEPVQDQVRERYAVLTQKLAAEAEPAEERGRAYGDVGLILMAAQYETAGLLSLANAQALAPRDPRWPYYLGQFHLARGERMKASEFFERALELRPNDLPTLVWLGETYLDEDRPTDAQALFAQALAVEPRSAAALAGLGRTALAQGDRARAAANLERALALEPGATRLHYQLALAYRGLGELEKAGAHLRQRGRGEAALPDPLMHEYNSLLESAEAYHNRGVLALAARESETAARLFRKGLELEPENATLGRALGIALSQMGEVDGAIEQYEDVLRRSPAYALAHFNLGVMFMSSGRYGAAVERFAAAVTLEPDNLEARLGLAHSLQRVGRAEASLPHWNHVVEVDPREVEAWIEGANVLVALERFAEAHAWLAAAKTIHPERPEIVGLHETLEAILALRRGR